MSLTEPSTLITAWVLVPLLVALASAGLGAGLSAVAGRELGALTLPAGYLTGMAVGAIALEAGIGAVPAVAILAALALAGAAHWLRARRRAGGRLRPAAAVLWAAGAALAAYAVALAPLALSGHSGVLGYALNNDSVNHIAIVELLRLDGASIAGYGTDSFTTIKNTFVLGYPLGVHVWPLFGTIATGIDPFHLWSPLIALSAAMAALVAHSILRSLGARPTFAATAGALVASGYLPLSYAAQGGGKEVAMGVAVYATVALLGLGIAGRATPRSLLPALVGALAAITVFSLGALAWIAPAGLAAMAVLAWRARAVGQRANPRRALLYGVPLALAAVPVVVAATRFADGAIEGFEDPLAVGNLLGPVPWQEAFNVWLAYDYRFGDPDLGMLTGIGVTLAAALAVYGLLHALRRRAFAIPVALLCGAAGAALVSVRFSIYFTAKAYPILALAIGIASAAGVLALARRGGLDRAVAVLAGIVLAAGVLASDAMVYAGAWLTPAERFDELAAIERRFEGRGPILVNDREQYTTYLLRGTQVWDTWGERQPNRGFRFGDHPLPLPHTPDFDDYKLDFIQEFPLLLDRKRPGGSRPPANYEVVMETDRHRVWRRVGPAPAMHIPLGARRLAGAAPLNCEQPEVARLFRAAQRTGVPLLAASGTSPAEVIGKHDWRAYEGSHTPVPEGMLSRLDGFARTRPELKPGRYAAYIQGSFQVGVRVSVDGKLVGEVRDDPSLPSGWHPMGEVEVTSRRPTVEATALHGSALAPGSHRFDLTGPLVFEPLAPARRIETVPVDEADRLCGRSLDWVELP